MIGIFLPGMTIILPWSAPSTPSFAACTAEICFPETATPELGDLYGGSGPAKLFVDRFCQSDYVIFGGVVAGEGGAGHETGTGSHVEEDSPVFFHHVPEEELAEDMDGGHVEVDQVEFFFQISFEKESVDPHAGVVCHKADSGRGPRAAGERCGRSIWPG